MSLDNGLQDVRRRFMDHLIAAAEASVHTSSGVQLVFVAEDVVQWGDGGLGNAEEGEDDGGSEHV
nr:uncharacterized protein CTRU02_15244 [Colletotrichum truncatum]KAF6781291.1 hypothetical protein CTRU02_15244 [Colletotrichum truncatum]